MSAADQVATNNKLLEEVGELKTIGEALKLQLSSLEFRIEKYLLDNNSDGSKRATRNRKTATVEEGEEVVEKKKRAPAKKKEGKKKEIVEDEENVDADEVVLSDAKKKRAPAKKKEPVEDGGDADEPGAKKKRAPAKKKEGKKRQTKAEKEASALAASVLDIQTVVDEDS